MFYSRNSSTTVVALGVLAVVLAVAAFAKWRFGKRSAEQKCDDAFSQHHVCTGLHANPLYPRKNDRCFQLISTVSVPGSIDGRQPPRMDFLKQTPLTLLRFHLRGIWMFMQTP